MENTKIISTYEAGQGESTEILGGGEKLQALGRSSLPCKGESNQNFPSEILFKRFNWKVFSSINQQLATLSSPYRLTPVTNESGFPTLDFQVYSSDKIVRPLKTLSNGEEFIVALAMALALAKMRAVYMPIETLLIDEGFGSLDFQNVEMVVQALSSLQLQDIQVGLISHVQSLD